MDYKGISLPASLVDEVEKIVNKKRFGYSSVTELVKDAIRRRLDELNSGVRPGEVGQSEVTSSVS